MPLCAGFAALLWESRALQHCAFQFERRRMTDQFQVTVQQITTLKRGEFKRHAHTKGVHSSTRELGKRKASDQNHEWRARSG